MTTAIGSLRDHLLRAGSTGAAAANIAMLLLFLAGVGYLLLKTYLLAEHAEYDFKYIWLAGEAWLRGMNPYDAAAYHALGQRLVTVDHVPVMWVYPPNWYLPAVLVAQTGLDAASVVWNVANVALLIGASGLLTSVYAPVRLERLADGPFVALLRRCLSSRWNVFFLHVFALAALEASALTLSVGQTSIVIYFGASLLIYGLSRNREMLAALGLAIVFLKPQLALLLFVALVMSRAHRMLVAKAIAISAAVSLPAFVVTPTVAADFVLSLTRYDGFTSANWPHSTTGLRHMVWEASGYDPGNIATMLIAIAIMVLIYWGFARARRTPEGTDLVVLATAITIAIAPLHMYDVVLVGLLLFVPARSGTLVMAVGGLGAALLWRADNLGKLTGFYGSGTEHFEGTRLTTIGAVLILVAVLEAVRRRPVPGAET